MQTHGSLVRDDSYPVRVCSMKRAKVEFEKHFHGGLMAYGGDIEVGVKDAS